jgi:hypothetical protein
MSAKNGQPVITDRNGEGDGWHSYIFAAVSSHGHCQVEPTVLSSWRIAPQYRGARGCSFNRILGSNRLGSPQLDNSLAAHDFLAPCRWRGACAARAISRAYCSITARRARFGSRRHSALRRSPRRSKHACLGMGSLLRDPHMSHSRFPRQPLPAGARPRRTPATLGSHPG